MQKQLQNVEDFHVKFNIGEAPKVPSLVDAKTSTLRYDLMKEENEEYLVAAKEGNLIEIADALGDQLYILCGTIQKHGLGGLIEEIFAEIQRSNMSKLDENGQPIVREDGKILKSSLYSKPDIGPIIQKAFPDESHKTNV